jgi:hypothetical protein
VLTRIKLVVEGVCVVLLAVLCIPIVVLGFVVIMLAALVYDPEL